MVINSETTHTNEIIKKSLSKTESQTTNLESEKQKQINKAVENCGIDIKFA